MNFIERYVAYLRDNPHGYWFKRKLYGWGWVPATWQGWVVTIVFAILIGATAAYLSVRMKAGPVSTGVLVWEVARLTGLVALLIIICYKTGEAPRWQWGTPKND